MLAMRWDRTLVLCCVHYAPILIALLVHTAAIADDVISSDVLPSYRNDMTDDECKALIKRILWFNTKPAESVEDIIANDQLRMNSYRRCFPTDSQREQHLPLSLSIPRPQSESDVLVHEIKAHWEEARAGEYGFYLELFLALGVTPEFCSDDRELFLVVQDFIFWDEMPVCSERWVALSLALQFIGTVHVPQTEVLLKEATQITSWTSLIGVRDLPAEERDRVCLSLVNGAILGLAHLPLHTAIPLTEGVYARVANDRTSLVYRTALESLDVLWQRKLGDVHRRTRPAMMPWGMGLEKDEYPEWLYGPGGTRIEQPFGDDPQKQKNEKLQDEWSSMRFPLNPDDPDALLPQNTPPATKDALFACGKLLILAGGNADDTSDKCLYRLALTDGRRSTFWEAPSPIVLVEPSPSGKHVAVAYVNDGLQGGQLHGYIVILNLEDGEVEMELFHGLHCAWNPDGVHLAVVKGYRQGDAFDDLGVWLVDVPHGTERRVTPAGTFVSWMPSHTTSSIVIYVNHLVTCEYNLEQETRSQLTTLRHSTLSPTGAFYYLPLRGDEGDHVYHTPHGNTPKYEAEIVPTDYRSTSLYWLDGKCLAQCIKPGHGAVLDCGARVSRSVDGMPVRLSADGGAVTYLTSSSTLATARLIDLPVVWKHCPADGYPGIAPDLSRIPRVLYRE